MVWFLIGGNLLDLRDGKAELSGRVLKRTSTFIKRLISAFQNRVKCPVLNKDQHFSDGGQAAGIIASVMLPCALLLRKLSRFSSPASLNGGYLKLQMPSTSHAKSHSLPTSPIYSPCSAMPLASSHSPSPSPVSFASVDQSNRPNLVRVALPTTVA